MVIDILSDDDDDNKMKDSMKIEPPTPPQSYSSIAKNAVANAKPVVAAGGAKKRQLPLSFSQTSTSSKSKIGKAKDVANEWDD